MIWNILIAVAVALIIALSVRSIVRRSKKGGCGCGCTDCEKQCPSRRDV